MVLILNGIASLLIIRIKGIKLLRGQTWVDDLLGAHDAGSILSILLWQPISLLSQCDPVRNWARMRQTLVAGLLDVWLASISDFDASPQRSFAGSLLAELPNMLNYRTSKRQALGCHVCRRQCKVPVQLFILR